MKKFGVSPVLLSVICSFCVGISAIVYVKKHNLDSFTVRNGVQQGYTIYSPCFNLYFCAMVDDRRRQCFQAGVNFCYHFGCKLVEDCTPKARLLRPCSTEFKFTNDVFYMPLPKKILRWLPPSLLLWPSCGV